MNPSSTATSSALDEETARAELYGLLAALYYAPPPAALLAQLRVAVTDAPAPGGFLEEPWRTLVSVARASWTMPPFTRNTMRCLVVWASPRSTCTARTTWPAFLNEKPLAALRGDLAELGLARDEAMSETEDHVACLCEVMRYLIAGDDVAVANLTQQKRFLRQPPAALGRWRCVTPSSNTHVRFFTRPPPS